MRKWLVLLGLGICVVFPGLFVSIGELISPLPAQAQYIGIYGQYYSPEDTARITVTIHDTTGLNPLAWDSANIFRYYRGVRIDSLDETNATSLRTGLYQIKFKADKEGTYTDADSIGQYTVVVQAFKYGVSCQGAFDYQVIRGNGLNGLFDIQWFLGAAHNGFRILFPVGGLAPKDSVQYYGIFDLDGNGLDDGDTVLVSTIHFYHGTIPQVLDSSKIVYHYTGP